MSDIHPLPLIGHDLETELEIRAKVFTTSPGHWYWSYEGATVTKPELLHGPFASQPEAFSSAYRMVELL